MRFFRLLAIAAAAAVVAVAVPLAMPLAAGPTAAPVVQVGKSGLPVPRFVSLKADRVNVRVGPGEDYGIAWVFTRASLPVEVIQEFDTWRRVRDSDGSVGWVFQSLLSGKRTAVIAPWAPEMPKAIRAEPDVEGAVNAYLQAGVLADVASCRRSWCRVSGEGFAGWIEQDQLWGVYPGEEIR
jgi:SH3-like domain-containing protein